MKKRDVAENVAARVDESRRRHQLNLHRLNSKLRIALMGCINTHLARERYSSLMVAAANFGSGRKELTITGQVQQCA